MRRGYLLFWLLAMLSRFEQIIEQIFGQTTRIREGVSSDWSEFFLGRPILKDEPPSETLPGPPTRAYFAQEPRGCLHNAVPMFTCVQGFDVEVFLLACPAGRTDISRFRTLQFHYTQ